MLEYSLMRTPRAAWLLLLFLLPLTAQNPAGEIRIQIRDSSGAPMLGEGRLRGPGVNRAFAADALGAHTFSQLPFGQYRLEVVRPGFARQTLTLDIQSSTPVTRTITMAVAQARASVEVVATTPLPGLNFEASQVPTLVQTATREDIERSGASGLEDFLNRRANGVHLNEMTGNPFQADVNYRGYTASPVLGTPQGLSIYMDGVRQNQPFGDIVSWDLIPQNAISTVTLISGSDPLFGLNTLGGALSIQTKDGVTSPGWDARVLFGSSGRKSLQAERGGGRATGFNWFLAANIFHEAGWRFDSPSDVRQGFAKLGWRQAKTDLTLTLSYFYNTLTGNALQDYRLLARDYASAYTVPDTINNRSPSFNFIARHDVNGAVTFSGNGYFRHIRGEGINGNLNNNSLDQSVYQPNATDQAALRAAGYSGFPTSGATAANTPFPKWRCIAQGLLRDEPVEKCNGLIVYSRSVQHSYGGSGQLSWTAEPGAGRNQLTAGAALNGAIADYTQNSQFGYLNPDRSITGIAGWGDGSTNSNGAPFDSRVNLHGRSPSWSLYVTDTLSLPMGWSITASGRFNHAAIDNSDRITTVSGPGSLNGRYAFNRLNAALGATYSPVAALNFYASYTEASRAPASIELGCADPVNPCSLPNAFASDPPLRQVSTGTWEAGVRGRLWSGKWNAGAFRGENRDDILFVASQQGGTGFFKNFGQTRREGFQASVEGRRGRVTAGLDYTFLSATYQSKETLEGAANSASDTALAGYPGLAGVITVHPGNRIPLTPKQNGKLFADVQATRKLLIDLSMVAASSAYARGNENNAHRPDGRYYQGPGVSPGYALFHIAAKYDLTKRLQVHAQVDNLSDRRFSTAAQLASTGLTPDGRYIARAFVPYGAGPQAGNYPIPSVVFVAPGAPRRAWAALRLRF